MRRRVGLLVGAVAVVGSVLGGCAGPAQAGSAVIVGDRAVSLSDVQSQLDVAVGRTEQFAQVQSQGGTAADVARDIVTREVLHALLERRAAAAGIVVTDADVEAELNGLGGADAVAEQSLYDVTALRSRVRDDLIAAQLANEVGGLSVVADLIAATSREQADAAADALRAGGPAADALFGDPRTAAREQRYSVAQNPGEAATPLFGTPQGGIVVFQPDPQQGTWIVLRVVERIEGAADQATAAALSQLERTQLTAIGERQVQPDVAEVGVRVNPRYGVWDPIALRVVAAEQVTGTVYPPEPAAAG